MGLYAGGGMPNIPAIAEAMRPALYAWFTGHIRLYDPELMSSTPYDPIADTGGEATRAMLFDSGVDGALIQPIRAASPVGFGDQQVGVQAVQFQTKLDLSAIARSGLIVEVVSGGNDPTLEAFQYSLLNGVDSTLAWGRIYEARAIMSGEAS